MGSFQWNNNCVHHKWTNVFCYDAKCIPLLWYICFRCFHHGKPDFHMSFVHQDNLQRLNQFWNQCSNSSLHGYQGTDSCLRGNVEPFFVTVFLQEAMTPISIFHLTRPGEVCWYFPFEINEQRVLPAFLVSIKLMWCPIFTPRQILENLVFQ